MFWELVIAVILGVIAGTFSGLTPGIHINLISVIVFSFAAVLSPYVSMLALAVFIISMGITHTFLDVIPSTFLGVPDADMVMGVLPAHQLLLEGKGYEAVKLTIIGSLCSLILGILLIPLLIFIVPLIYESIEFLIGWLILAVVLFMILKESTLQKKLWAFLVFSFAGVLGIIVLDFPNLSQPLLPLLSGLFGISGLLLSLANNTTPPPQEITETIYVEKKTTAQALCGAVFSGWITSLLPGLGSAQGAILSSAIFRNLGDYGYLILVGGINTVNFLLSLVTFYTLEKSRNGAVVVIQELLQSITLNQLVIMAVASLIVGGIAAWLCMGLTRISIRLFDNVPYALLCWSVISIVIFFVLYFSGITGLVVLFISTALGIIAPLVGVGRNHAMGCLLVPVMIFFLA